MTSHTYTEIPEHVRAKAGRRLDTNPSNPVGAAVELIKNFFLKPGQGFHNPGPGLSYVSFESEPVTIRDNFDELQVPLDHVSREPCDNFYVSKEYVRNFARNKAEGHSHILADAAGGQYSKRLIDRMSTELGHSSQRVLPTHTTSHLPELLRRGITRAIYSGQVFRRDAIDAKHYPVFHQLDGILLFTRKDLSELRSTYGHSSADKSDDELIMDHLKSTLEGLVNYMLRRVVVDSGSLGTASNSPKCEPKKGTDIHECDAVRGAAAPHRDDSMEKPSSDVTGGKADELMRWDSDTSFPFTDPSLELYVKRGEDWIEILGCGQLKNIIITNILGGDGGSAARRPDAAPSASKRDSEIVGGWAFGIGLERLVMALCGISDIRQFWETDERFLRQYRDSIRSGTLPVFKPYSRNPPVARDISFYVDGAVAGKKVFDELEFRGIIEELCRDYVEDVTQLSEYPQTQTLSQKAFILIWYAVSLYDGALLRVPRDVAAQEEPGREDAAQKREHLHVDHVDAAVHVRNQHPLETGAAREQVPDLVQVAGAEVDGSAHEGVVRRDREVPTPRVLPRLHVVVPVPLRHLLALVDAELLRDRVLVLEVLRGEPAAAEHGLHVDHELRQRMGVRHVVRPEPVPEGPEEARPGGGAADRTGARLRVWRAHGVGLRLLCGSTQHGRAQVHGRLNALLEVGEGVVPGQRRGETRHRGRCGDLGQGILYGTQQSLRSVDLGPVVGELLDV
ncbi:phenylalanyl-tRNA synthetase [Babesia caballi]|uniref:phenylalanine--tRNA ligase n=1 Tax=Babesia caballi TaxID=5871 RepID=A0AAV4LV65_BABCB|nr:phenylalanyl-tRNA synthetase [Babesia caballi]